MIELAVEILFTITTALKGPVVLCLLLALAWALFEVGRFLREGLQRRLARRRWSAAAGAFADRTDHDEGALFALLAGEAAPALVRRLVPELREPFGGGRSRRLTRLLQRVELEAARRLARLRIGLRLGPVLGLLGTLIPMGPALMNVSQGKLELMSRDLIIAFGTTVVGLLVGALCYVMLVVRQHWYAGNLADLEHLTSLVDGEEAP